LGPLSWQRIPAAAYICAGWRFRTSKYAKNIKECWGFDSLYNADDVDHWIDWARRNQQGTKLFMVANGCGPSRNTLRLSHLSKQLLNVETTLAEINDHFKLLPQYFGKRMMQTGFLQNTVKPTPEISGYGAYEWHEAEEDEELETDWKIWKTKANPTLAKARRKRWTRKKPSKRGRKKPSRKTNPGGMGSGR
jgi:hypothetical protein